MSVPARDSSVRLLDGRTGTVAGYAAANRGGLLVIVMLAGGVRTEVPIRDIREAAIRHEVAEADFERVADFVADFDDDCSDDDVREAAVQLLVDALDEGIVSPTMIPGFFSERGAASQIGGVS